MKDEEHVGVCFAVTTTYNETNTETKEERQYNFTMLFDDQELSQYQNIPSLKQKFFDKHKTTPNLEHLSLITS